MTLERKKALLGDYQRQALLHRAEATEEKSRAMHVIEPDKWETPAAYLACSIRCAEADEYVVSLIEADLAAVPVEGGVR